MKIGEKQNEFMGVGLREIGKREMKKAFVNRFFIHNGL